MEAVFVFRTGFAFIFVASTILKIVAIIVVYAFMTFIVLASKETLRMGSTIFVSITLETFSIGCVAVA